MIKLLKSDFRSFRRILGNGVSKASWDEYKSQISAKYQPPVSILSAVKKGIDTLLTRLFNSITIKKVFTRRLGYYI
ncbi:MAG: hypothetical protein A3H69_02530 [Candidatus Sungbacteria bacterium RIFCSPLOWO2_02_FULL_47_9]|nr:MAG: hypothetical protein A3H69_02530 [Candidatus Sungbacteria bacterium RIFCSPLOWO2_02_FULL_47_9]